MDEKCILVVDDDENVRNIISEMLMKCGYKAITVRSGQDALESFKKKRCDLLITDMEMPGMTGIDLLKTIKNIAPEIGVIIVSDSGSVDSYLELMTLGVFEYLNKPIRMGELKKTVTTFFNDLVVERSGESIMPSS